MIIKNAFGATSSIFGRLNFCVKLHNKKKFFLAGLVTVLLAGCNETSQDTLQAVSELWPVVEIGREGACANAGYIYEQPYGIQNYGGTKKLLSSQLIGDASVNMIVSAQLASYQPYDGLGLLPGGATLPRFTPPNDDNKIYRITYRSNDQKLSGLVVIPDQDISNGIIVYDHATQIDKYTGAPSNPSNEACIVITGLAGKGRMLAMPDYIGYGKNNGKHPYPLGINNAPAGIDIIVAAHELAGELHKNKSVGSQLAVTGYSEGGGNALWLAREIADRKPDLMGSKLTMIAPMSGPYDMSGAMAHSLVVRQPGTIIPANADQLITFFAHPLLAAYAAQGAADYSQSKLSSMLRPTFLGFAKSHPLPISGDNLQYGLGLIVNSTLTGYTLITPNPALIMQNRFVQAVRTTNRQFPAINLWVKNDNINWIPKNAEGRPVPAYITGILQDQIVPFAGKNYPLPSGYTGGEPIYDEGNSQNLIASLRSKGVTSSYLAWCGIDAQQVPTIVKGKQIMMRINHLTGLPPVLTLAAQAIESGALENLPTIPDP